MPDVFMRKTVLSVEEIHQEGGPVASAPAVSGWFRAVIENPFTGHYAERFGKDAIVASAASGQKTSRERMF